MVIVPMYFSAEGIKTGPGGSGIAITPCPSEPIPGAPTFFGIKPPGKSKAPPPATSLVTIVVPPPMIAGKVTWMSGIFPGRAG